MYRGLRHTRTGDATKTQRSRIRIKYGILIVALLICAGIVVTLSVRNTLVVSNTSTLGPIIGHAFFVSSGQLNENSTQGINDELQIDLHGIPNPIPGKSYYAWLLSDKSQVNWTPILLGRVDTQHNELKYLYVNPHHTNLLAITSRFLITEEDANITPTNPSPNPSNWRYYAELPQTPDPTDLVHHFSMLSHLRFILSEDPMIKEQGFSGGLASWLVRNTGKVLEWAGSAKDYWASKSVTLMRNHLIRILEYLDGKALVQRDLPPATPLLVDSRLASLPLLGFDIQEQTTPTDQIYSDYLHGIGNHLIAIAQAPGATAEKRGLADEINTAINNLASWLKQVHDYAVQLVKMTGAELVLPESLIILDKMQLQAFYAYAGQLDPSTNTLQKGATQIYENIGRLATFDITAYTQH